jgi:hypothetical protein
MLNNNSVACQVTYIFEEYAFIIKDKPMLRKNDLRVFIILI